VNSDRYKGFSFDPGALAEAVDLDPGRRREILFVDGSLASWTHFEVLELDWNAPPEAARAAYVEKVKLFHPDRYPGKRLGTFRPRLERIFRRLTEARDVLVDPERRAAYARSTAPAAEAAKLEARKLEEERRLLERRGRLARQNPILARATRISELLARGKASMAAGRFAQAANDFTMVAGLEPGHREAAELATECRKRSLEGKVQEWLDKAASAEAMEQWAAALAAYRTGLEVDPGNFRLSILASRAAMAGGDAVAAHGHAVQAVGSAPRNAAAHEALGLALEAMGRKDEAKKAFECAVDLDDRLESAKERLKKLRWSFLR
jgi:tetratricopeptide (TPR) repeat protein